MFRKNQYLIEILSKYLELLNLIFKLKAQHQHPIKNSAKVKNTTSLTW